MVSRVDLEPGFGHPLPKVRSVAPQPIPQFRGCTQGFQCLEYSRGDSRGQGIGKKIGSRALPQDIDDFRGLARLRQKTKIRIAGGEMNRRWHDFKEMHTLGSLDVYQPDVVLTGGITGVKQIAAWVQNKEIWFSPHTWSNGIGLLANLQLACAVSKCPYLEFPLDPPAWTTQRRDYMLHPEDRLMIDDSGYLHIPEKPGLGCELDKKALSRYEVNTVFIGKT
jgi:L-alanine-DL-glutamate epimerase-like enolase superfamily enzyme